MKWRNKPKGRYAVMAIAAAVCLGPALSEPARASEADEWKTWQKKYNETIAAKQPARKAMWLQKELVAKKLVIDDAKLPNTKKRGKVTEACLTCHDGIEQISAFHPTEEYGCTICHGSAKPASVVKKEAHQDMIAARSGKGLRNPSNLRILEKSCGLGGCHNGHEQQDRNHVNRVRRTVMGLQSGISGGLRYQYASQDSKFSTYSGVAQKNDGYIAAHRGGLAKLDTLPVFSAKDLPTDNDGKIVTVDDMGNPMSIGREIADSQWRKECARCHFWNEGAQGPADYRAQGCAACHVLYDDDGLYKGSDPTIPLDERGHGKVHQVTTAVPAQQCIHCHNRGGRTGVSYEGRVESDFYGTPFEAGNLSSEVYHGKYYNTPVMDVHYEKGMECIDCHTQFDTMGDEQIYSKKHEQAEVRCQDCHGTYKQGIVTTKVTDPDDRVIRLGKVSPNYENKVGDEMVVTARGNKYTNAKIIDGEPILISKFDGREHLMPLITNKKNGVHAIPQHQERMECWACHARHTSQCYGCHDNYNQMAMGQDKLSGQKAKGTWPEQRTYVRYDTPLLGISPKGLVTTYVPGCNVFLNAINDQGEIIGDFDNFIFQSAEGYSSVATNPIFTHSIRTEVRSCEDCHLHPKAMGLGDGQLTIDPDPSGSKDHMQYVYEMERSGLSAALPLDVMATPQGNQVASTSHVGARPFNQAELNRVLKVGNCLACHDGYDDPIYQNIYQAYADYPTKCKKDEFVKKNLAALK